jgi:hypothetical protein
MKRAKQSTAAARRISPKSDKLTSTPPIRIMDLRGDVTKDSG